MERIIMTLAQKIEQVLKDELRQENIKTVIDLAEFLKYKEAQQAWGKINESEAEYLTDSERVKFEELKGKGEFIDQEELLKELGIHDDELQS